MTEVEKIKLIERTCKRDAYQSVYLWIKGGAADFTPTHGDAAWYAKEKMDSHNHWLAEQPYQYRYVDGFVCKRCDGTGEIDNGAVDVSDSFPLPCPVCAGEASRD